MSETAFKSVIIQSETEKLHIIVVNVGLSRRNHLARTTIWINVSDLVLDDV